MNGVMPREVFLHSRRPAVQQAAPLCSVLAGRVGPQSPLRCPSGPPDLTRLATPTQGPPPLRCSLGGDLEKATTSACLLAFAFEFDRLLASHDWALARPGGGGWSQVGTS